MQRLKQNREFQRVYEGGRYFAHPLLVLYVLPRAGQPARLGFSVGKKVGNAVIRNRVRRQLREITRLQAKLPTEGVDLVILGRAKAAEADYHQLQAAFLNVVGRAQSWLRSRKEQRTP